MIKYIFNILIVISITVSANTDKSPTLLNSPDGCLMGIQNLKKSSKKDFYTSLIFDNNIQKAQKKAQKEILKKINLQISATTTMYYKNETFTKNSIILKEKTFEEFKFNMSIDTTDINIESLPKKEYYCKDDGELFFLYLLKREDVYQYALDKLKSLSLKNKKIFNRAKHESNFLTKTLLLENIKTNYLPYLMILQSSQSQKYDIKRYLKEIVKYEKAYNRWMKNVVFYISIKYPYSRVYPIENRVKEVQEIIKKLLRSHSIYASNLNGEAKNFTKKFFKTSKEIVLIEVQLKDNNSRYKLNFNLYCNGKRSNNLSIHIPENMAGWELNLANKVNEYNKNHSILYNLANLNTNF